jgi:outer membrane protein OmpA-like peptidoglycan-associated protein
MKKILILLLMLVSIRLVAAEVKDDKPDEIEIMQKAVIKVNEEDITITISKVNVSDFPKIKIFFEAYKQNGKPVDEIKPNEVKLFERGEEKKVLDIKKIKTKENSNVDFVFIMDKTATMKLKLNQIKNNIVNFADALKKANINYRLGLITFSDIVEKIYQPTADVNLFKEQLNTVYAELGGDTKENALEAIEAAVKKIKYREEANKIAMIITDAPYHQAHEEGNGTTNQTTESITKLLQNNSVRLFSLVPERLKQYRDISYQSRGSVYDIKSDFSQTLTFFTGQISNIFTLTYSTAQQAIPDSIEIALFEPNTKKWVKRNVAIAALGRKLIIENLLFKSASVALSDSIPELDLIADFMKVKPEMKVIVEGHTDNIGPAIANYKLSVKRAEAVKQYLVRRGVVADRIRTKGYGEKKPIATNFIETGRRLNRRTELVIVSE